MRGVPPASGAHSAEKSRKFGGGSGPLGRKSAAWEPIPSIRSYPAPGLRDRRKIQVRSGGVGAIVHHGAIPAFSFVEPARSKDEVGPRPRRRRMKIRGIVI